MNGDVENCYGFYIITSGLKTKLIWKPKGIGKTFEEELKKLANVLVDGYG
jgi:hypothetical protein